MSDHSEPGGGRVCPTSHARLCASPLRRLIQNPDKILGELVHEGDTVVDVGCGPGFFSLAMAKMVGDEGRVIAVDLQEEMLEALRKRAENTGLMSRIRTHKCDADRIGVNDPADFVLAFYVVHESPDVESFLKEIAGFLKPGGRLLVVEPKMMVSPEAFQETIELGRKAGMQPIARPRIWLSNAVLFERAC